MMHWGNFGGMGYGGFGPGWIFMVLFWALVIFGIVYLARQLFIIRKAGIGGETAEDILRKRYASGEITTNEYNEKLDILGKKH